MNIVQHGTCHCPIAEHVDSMFRGPFLYGGNVTYYQRKKWPTGLDFARWLCENPTRDMA